MCVGRIDGDFSPSVFGVSSRYVASETHYDRQGSANDSLHEHAPQFMNGTPEDTSLQIKRLERRWVVENGVGESVGNADDVEGAIRIAQLTAEVEGASVILVLAADGSVEKTLSVDGV